MKVLIISDSSVNAIGNSFYNSFESLGHDVKSFDLQQEINKFILGGKIGQKINMFWPVESWIKKGNRVLALIFQNFQPDLVWVSGNVPILYGTFAHLKSLNPDCKIALFWPDPLINLSSSILSAVSFYDIVATYSRNTIPVFTKIGFQKVCWFPFAGDSRFIKESSNLSDNRFRFDIGFIGGWRPERERVMKILVNNFNNLRFDVRGYYWKQNVTDKALLNVIKGAPILGEQYFDYFKHVRININVMDDLNYPAANMRFFEIPSVAGLQLSSYCPEMKDIFKDGEHLFYFQSEDDLCERVKYILDNPAIANTIRASTFQLIKSNHTYEIRIQNILDSL